jgi:hypothetical protein
MEATPATKFGILPPFFRMAALTPWEHTATETLEFLNTSMTNRIQGKDFWPTNY